MPELPQIALEDIEKLKKRVQHLELEVAKLKMKMSGKKWLQLRNSTVAKLHEENRSCKCYMVNAIKVAWANTGYPSLTARDAKGPGKQSENKAE